MYASITVNDVKLYIDILAISYSLLIHTRSTHIHTYTHTKICMECAKKPSPFLFLPIDFTTNFESTFIAIKTTVETLFFTI